MKIENSKIENSDLSPVFSVGEFLDFVNELLGARDFAVQGEVVEAKDHPTGFYFRIKDPADQATMDCYMSPFAYRGLGIAIEQGMVVKVGGVASVWKKRGQLSFRVETLELAGEGSLKKAYEALKKKLTEEGLFERKRPLPEFISRVGLITSRTGAVTHDFRQNLLALGLRVSQYDSRVEGAQAPVQLRQALAWFNVHAEDFDVLVIVRGGGSLEDLQAFNDEWVVRAIFGSRLPTIVAIGHAPNMPLAQMTADAKADTPTAAAVLINSSWDRLRNIDQNAQRLEYAFDSLLTSIRADMQSYTHRLSTQLARLIGRGRELAQRLAYNLERIGDSILRARQDIDAAERHLIAASPERLLRLGYSIVSDETGAVVRSVSQLRHDQIVTTMLGKGSFTSEVKELKSKHD